MHRTLVIGVAGRGLGVAALASENEHFELCGIADIDEANLAKAGEHLDVPAEGRHLDYKEALASGRYEVAIIVAPTNLHYAMTKDVLNAGLHCLTEKPFTLTLAEADELVELADAKKLVLQVVQNYRYEEMFQKISALIREESLGRLASITGAFHLHRPPREGKDQGIDFPLLFIQSIHHIDWLVSVLPPITKVLARHQSVPWSKWEGPSICHMIFQCENGVLATYCGSYETVGDMSHYDGRWRLEFEHGDLVVDADRWLWKVTEKGGKRESLYHAGTGRTGMQYLYDDLHKAIVDGVEPPTSGRQNLKTLKVLFEVIEAGK